MICDKDKIIFSKNQLLKNPTSVRTTSFRVSKPLHNIFMSNKNIFVIIYNPREA